MKRFERFNEMIFESYCMKSVLNAIKKERNRKDARGEVEQSLSTLTDAMLYALSTEDNQLDYAVDEILSARSVSWFPSGFLLSRM